MPTFLDQILKAKGEELSSSRYRTPLSELKSRCRDMESPRPFRKAITSGKKGEVIRLIAEIKKASPSKGLLVPTFDPVGLARIYEEHGAAALSVLTERFFFLGDPDYLRSARAAVSLPVLRKDFLLGDYHVYEARAMGADAVLLIVRILEFSPLRDLIALAGELGMGALVEVHSDEEIEIAVKAGAPILGINNRDLETFRVDLRTTLDLIPKIPPGTVIVSESGIAVRDDVTKVREAGVDAVLVGEALVTSGDPGKKIRELLNP